MKKKIIQLFMLLMVCMSSYAQETTSSNANRSISSEKFGKALNLGLGLGYYGYMGQNSPVVHADMEFDVVRDFTLAPFITYYSYQNNYYWGDSHYPYRNYTYRQTVVPIGVKASYYFDRLLNAGPKWDFYLAGSLGFAIRSTRWESGYYGSTTVNTGASALYLDGHAGTEYHLGNKIGLFLDLSTGISTIGMAVHI